MAEPATSNAARAPAEWPVHPRARGHRRLVVRRVVDYVVLVVVAAVVLFPVWVVVVGAIQPPSRVLDYPASLVPTELTLEVLADAWDVGSYERYYVNSIVMTGLIVVGQVVTSVFAAYAFAFLSFPFRRTVFALFLATLMVPTEVTVVANFETVRAFGWLDSYPGLVAPFMAAAFGTFLLRQTFLALPRELGEAAALDGMGHLAFLRGVVVPLSRPAIAALAVFSFLTSWNQYLWPLIVTNDPDMRTVQIGLRSLASANIDQPNLIMAGTVIVSIPIVVLLIVFQRQLIRGLTAGAVKG